LQPVYITSKCDKSDVLFIAIGRLVFHILIGHIECTAEHLFYSIERVFNPLVILTKSSTAHARISPPIQAIPGWFPHRDIAWWCHFLLTKCLKVFKLLLAQPSQEHV